MKIPGDIFSIKIPYNEKHSFRWPVSQTEIINLKKILENNLNQIALSCSNKKIRNILLIIYKWLIVEYLSLLQGCCIIRGTERNGDKLQFTSNSPLFLGLQERGFPYSEGVAPLKLKREPPSSVFYKSLKSLRRITRQIQWAGIKGFHFGSYADPYTVAVMSCNSLLLDMLRHSKPRVYYLMPHALMPPDSVDIEAGLKIEVQNLSKNLCAMLLDLLTTIGWQSNKDLANYIFNMTFNFLMQTGVDYIYVQNIWKDRSPHILWTGTGGSYWVRIARAIVQDKGGEVSGFEHGGPTGVFYLKDMYYMEGLFTNRFFSFTKTSAELYKENIRFWPFDLPLIQLEACDLPHIQGFRDLMNTKGALPDSSMVKRVMYVPTVFRGEKQCPETILMDDIVYLDWQARLVETLNKAGFEVLCKPHPEGILNGKPFEYSSACKFYYDRFEDIWDKADAFIFDYSATTAFWHALCTKKPVIWINHGLHPWHNEPYELIKRRCFVVDAFFDKNNHLQMDFNKLILYLKEPIREPDMEFIRRYMTGF